VTVRVTDSATGTAATATRALSITISAAPTVPISPGAGTGATATPTPTPSPSPSSLPESGGIDVPVDVLEEVTVTSGVPAVVTVIASTGASARVDAPTGALPAGATLTVAAVTAIDELGELAPPPSSTTTLVLAFVVQARDSDGDALEGPFAEPVELTFTVSASDLPEGANAGDISLTYWNGARWVEVEVTATVGNDGVVTFTATVDHFTVFALAHLPGRGTFAPAPAPAGLTLTAWRGGPHSLLAQALGSHASAWTFVDGQSYGYSPGLPPIVSTRFLEQFPGGLPPGTLVIIAQR